MRFRSALSSLFLAALVAGVPATRAAEMQPPRPSLPAADAATAARVIVKFRDSASTVREHGLAPGLAPTQALAVLQQRADALGARRGRTLTTGRGLSDRTQVMTATGVDADTLARELRADGDVEYVEVDQRRTRLAVPNDPLYAPSAGISPSTGQWYLKTPTAVAVSAGTDIVSSINAPAAWDVTTGSTAIVVAVIDTGIRADHPDLSGQVLAGYDMVTDSAVANDGDGRDADPSDPGDYVTSTDLRSSTFSSCSVADSSWHGTMVAGLIGAIANNGTGMAGVAWNTRILPVRVLGKCFGYDSDIIAGMRWAAGLTVAGVPANPNPARVLNMSLGGTGSCSSSYADAVSEIVAAGSVIVVAAGNSSGHSVGVPGNCSGVVTVAGLRHAGTKVGYSDVGTAVAIGAPGGNCVNTTGECLYPMLSTTNTGTTTPVAGSAGATYTNGTDYAVGTSFSAPLVSGTVALMLAANPSLTPSRITSLLKSTARAYPTTGGTAGIASCRTPNGTDQLECYCTTSTCGAGMLDAGAAVAAASGLVTAVSNLQAKIAASPAIPSPGDSVVLSAASSVVDSGRSIASYTWSLVDGGSIVTGFSSGTSGSSATVVPSATGSFTVRLTLVDSAGATSTADATVTVDAVSVQVATSPTAPTVGQTVTVSASNLQLGSGRSVASWGWSIVSGSDVVTAFSSVVNTSTATLVPTAAGSFTVRLTVINDLGKQATADATVTVAAVPVASSGTSTETPTSTGTTTTTTADSSSGSSGGGAASPDMLLGLVAAAAALGLSQVRRRSNRAAKVP